MKKRIITLIIILTMLMISLYYFSVINNSKIFNNKLVQDSNAELNDVNIHTATALYNYDYSNYKDLPVNYSHTSYLYDISTPEKAIGLADYAFIGKINGIIRTEYRHPMETVIDGEIKTVTSPYTVYSVTVIENIKGELIQTQDIEVVECGGLEQDQKSYSFFDNMGLLNIGDYYILLVYTSSNDGTLLIDNSNLIVPLGNGINETTNQEEIISNKPNATPTDIINTYINAAKNPVVYNNIEVTKSKIYDIQAN